jgi:hypothetical protein
MEVVGQVPKLRRAERARGGGGSAPFSHQHAQVLGMGADDVFGTYVKKSEVNFKRQDSGYTQKDHDDSKHI